MNDTNKQKWVTALLFAVYIVAIIWIIIFKFQLSLDTLPRQRIINLVPDLTANRNDEILNLLVFVPYGVYMGMLKRSWSFGQQILPVFLTSLLFETVQYAFAIGSSDINDLLLNTVGGAVGIFICFVFRKVFKARSDRILNVLALLATILVIGFIWFLSTFVTYRF